MANISIRAAFERFWQHVVSIVPTKMSDLSNDTGYLTSYTETDPTVPQWAKAETKPTYTKFEIGLGNVDNTSDSDKPVSIATQTALDNLKDELSESIVSESEEWTIVDSNGNIIATVNADGFETTNIIAQNLIVNGNEVGANNLGVYVQDIEPTNAVAGDIWIDTISDPSFISPSIPEITEADNGKVLMVVNGTLQLVSLNLSVDANGVVSM